jgi:hypothetical protein
MRILAALFIDTIDLRPVDGPSTRIDLGGIKFSQLPEGGYPCTLEPHLVVLVHNPPEGKPDGVLEVTYWREPASVANGQPEQLARNVQPLQVEPGKFNYRLVRAELTFEGPGTIEARCSLDRSEPVIVPLTLLPTPPS